VGAAYQIPSKEATNTGRDHRQDQRKIEIEAEKADKDVTKANKRVKIAKKVKKEEKNME
jgi:hypothetical protein